MSVLTDAHSIMVHSCAASPFTICTPKDVLRTGQALCFTASMKSRFQFIRGKACPRAGLRRSVLLTLAL